MNRSVLVVSAILLAGCVEAPVYEGRFAYDDGWSIGKVAEVGTARGGFGRSSKDCRLSAIAQGKGERTFAHVDYQRGKHYRSIIATVPEGLRVAPGDEVYVNFQDCDAEIASRHLARTH
ncbi:MAG TPA: hypothetical protein VLH12_04250 [Usitatibacter sp.]|nr:hypothetical protein [Usitatibacter sp.]